MKKEFLPYDIVRNNALKLAKNIYSCGFIPDVIYVSLRGGAYLGNVISEYFKIIRGAQEKEVREQEGEAGIAQRLGRPVYYAAVVARSYTDVRKSDQIKVEGWTYAPDHLRIGDKVLLVDDIFDSGRTINHLAGIILEKGIPRDDLKIAVHDYKFFHDKAEQLPVQPDFWCRKHELSIHDEDSWIHYMSHELVGLSPAELEKYYYRDDPDLRGVLDVLGKSS